MSTFNQHVGIKDAFIMPTDGLEPAKSKANAHFVVAIADDGQFYRHSSLVRNNQESLSKAVSFISKITDKSASRINMSFWRKLERDWVKNHYPFCTFG
ncbi:hypothetical protein VCHA53O466_50145 [Vibrio chagasii]|nr:hypothetical protein VCHA53O466_50145 [Vibrio chagasii]